MIVVEADMVEEAFERRPPVRKERPVAESAVVEA